MAMVHLTAEWAVWGKHPGDRDYQVQSCSGGRLTPDNVTTIMDRFNAGTPDRLPQVTISWFGGAHLAHVGVAIQEWSDQQDRVGRLIAITRYFCVPYPLLADHPVSYEALFHAFEHITLPADGPVRVDVPSLDPREIADRVSYEAMGTAALLFTRNPVCVVEADNVPLLDRLRFLDTVAALLPYGLRSKLSAATWASSTAAHRIRLSFSKYAPSGARMVVWGRAPIVSGHGTGDAETYVRLLTAHRDTVDLVAHLAQATEPSTFRPSSFPEVVELLERTAGAPGAHAGASAYDLIKGCADAFDERDAEGLEQRLAALAFVMATREHSDEERAALLETAKERRLLAEHQKVPRIADYLFEVLLTSACGDVLEARHLDAIGDAAGGLHPALLDAMLRRPAREPAVTLTLSHLRGDGRLADEARRMRTASLAEAAAEPPARLWLVEAVCDELATRSGDRELAHILRHHHYLAGQLATVYAGRGDLQLKKITGLLTAAYGPTLNDGQFDEILGRWPVLPPAALFAAVIAMYGRGARDRLLDVTLTDFLTLASFGEETLEELLALLRAEDGPGGTRRRMTIPRFGEDV